ncbi:hypothetical protein [Proteus terrae]|uniref:Uncharacterized protein n=1 Tax=Proteus terrae subsp. cibarius TaxID=626774 RepID=A0A6G6SXU0_9GAMM|nr:hypothetical protein [Proteus terrae]QHP78040.1 hypothetical protein EKQ45_19780 [Proteus vulgaris]MBG2914022.1 hypothetical protein [Proteus terrae subsp. cibarius]QHD93883.1 hypothetical protein GSM99_04360 [Proteus terrae subsp. cibarius]QIF99558.1 hypothetical protein GTH25_16560 [Proteus terrae subsp. cibarius]QJW52486.1 hypothetical protein HND96_17080 [Proteus terrae subsp. cibarius]
MENSRFKDLCEQLKAAGATNPKSWANSELQENIPQFARFLVLKGFTDIYRDVEGNLSEMDIYSDEAPEVYQKLASQFDEQELKELLHFYGKSIIGKVIDMLDQSYLYDVNGNVGWSLMELDNKGTTTDRLIQDLHEDFLEFEESELAPNSKA